MTADVPPLPFGSYQHLCRVLAASGVVGTWSWFENGDRCVLDAGAAGLLGGDPALTGRSLSPHRARARLHPDDRDRVLARFAEACRSGGPFVVPYRILLPDGGVRALLDRGRIFRGDGGAPGHGHGLLLDLGESAREEAGAAGPLEQAAAQAIACRRSIDRLGATALRPVIDRLLLRIAQEMVRRERSFLH
ncbi:PAS domain-containing protein [Methylobacterium oxalidis]|uniref:PAS domain-containing protein n=1 Tax=Methylobacterium oxalidis TaxID=944322 RepID=UPI0033157262